MDKHWKYSNNWTVEAVGSFIYSNAKYPVSSVLVKAKLLLIYRSTITEDSKAKKISFSLQTLSSFQP